MNDNMYEKLGAYFDGELPADQQEEMRLSIAANSEYQRTINGFQRVSDSLRNLPKFRVPLDLNLSDKILSEADARCSGLNAALNTGAIPESANGELNSNLFATGMGGQKDSNPTDDSGIFVPTSDFDYNPNTSYPSSEQETSLVGSLFYSQTPWRVRLSRALLWPMLVLALAMGFWMSRQDSSSGPVVVINNSPQTEESEMVTGSRGSAAPLEDSNSFIPVRYESDPNSSSVSVAQTTGAKNGNPQLVDAQKIREAIQPAEISINESENLFEKSVPFLAHEAKTAKGERNAKIPGTSKKNDVETGANQPSESEIAESGAAAQRAPNPRTTASDGTEPLRAINVSSNNKETFINETNLKFDPEASSAMGKPTQLTYQCRFNAKNFDVSAWTKLLADFGVQTPAVQSLDKTSVSEREISPKTPDSANAQAVQAEKTAGKTAENTMALSGNAEITVPQPCVWLWNSQPQQRAEFMEKAKGIAGIESVESELVTVDIKPGEKADEKASWTKIRLIPVE